MASDTHPPKAPLARRLVIDFAIMTIVGVVLALIGPFGSFQDPLATRLIVWVGLAYAGYALYTPIDTLAKRLAPVLQLPVWTLQLVACLIATVPMAIIVWVLPRYSSGVEWPGASVALQHYLQVLVIGAMITAVFVMVRRDPAPEAAPVREPAPKAWEQDTTARATFIDRLPPELGTQLIALEMEDHYVRAHTALGSDLVLMRMRDAVAELDGIEGRQVHRSWWVARGAVSDVKREGRNIRLVLDGGLEAPVSRANVAPLKDAGWL